MVLGSLIPAPDCFLAFLCGYMYVCTSTIVRPSEGLWRLGVRLGDASRLTQGDKALAPQLAHRGLWHSAGRLLGDAQRWHLPGTSGGPRRRGPWRRRTGPSSRGTPTTAAAPTSPLLPPLLQVKARKVVAGERGRELEGGGREAERARRCEGDVVLGDAAVQREPHGPGHHRLRRLQGQGPRPGHRRLLRLHPATRSAASGGGRSEGGVSGGGGEWKGGRRCSWPRRSSPSG